MPDPVEKAAEADAAPAAVEDVAAAKAEAAPAAVAGGYIVPADSVSAEAVAAAGDDDTGKVQVVGNGNGVDPGYAAVTALELAIRAKPPEHSLTAAELIAYATELHAFITG